MIIKMLGSSGTRPLINRPLTSAFVHSDDKNILIDCGEGTQLQLQALKCRISKIDIICITHLHPDHVLGLPCLLSTMSTFKKSSDLLIIGPAGIKDCVLSLLAPVSCLGFKLQFFELDGNSTKLEFDRFSITAFKVKHSIVCYGYKLVEYMPPKFDAEFIESSNLPDAFWCVMHKGGSVSTNEGIVNRNYYFGEDRLFRSFVYAVDTRPCKRLMQFCRDADVLVLEAMYSGNNTEFAREKNHMLLSESLDIFKRSKAKNLVITHFSPSTRVEHFQSEIDKCGVTGVVCASVGVCIELEKEVKVSQ